MFLGRRVAAAFGHDRGWYDWRLARGRVAMAVPHPSGQSRIWNDLRAAERAAMALHYLNEPCVHVEGPDGAGKSTLVVRLAQALDAPVVGTHGPPGDAAESWRLLDERLGHWRVVDRSTGLISELVYGPIVRGHTVVPERELWSAVRAVKNVVTFVYCRPPTTLVASHCARVRRGEEPAHVAAVVKNIERIVDTYDQTMDHVSRLGCRVVEYDWTTDHVENVVEAVCAA